MTVKASHLPNGDNPLVWERKEDIPLLATLFVELLVNELGCPKPKQGFHKPGDVEDRLGFYVGQLRR